MEEVWKDIPNYEGLYKISSYGNIKSLKRKAKNGRSLEEIFLKTSIARGYKITHLCKNGIKKTYPIHKLVAIIFLNHTPCGNNIVINHKDENKLNNNIENLELCSHRYNDIYSSKNKNGYTGVWSSCQKYCAGIVINGKREYLGRYKTKEEAGQAYLDALSKL